jgi:hypothetical protein
MLSEEKKDALSALAIGKNVNRRIPIEDQLAALREQVAELSTATKTPLRPKITALETIVAEEKAKREKKSVEEPPLKKSGAKSSKGG